MKNLILLAALVAVVPLTPTAAMDVATYVKTGEALMAKGPLAPLSGDYKILMDELRTSSGILKKERLAAIKSGRAPAYCPTGGIGPSEVFVAFRAIPAARQRLLKVKEALRAVYARKYPCAS